MSGRCSLALVGLCLVPTEVLADGVSPLLNLFHRDTWLPASLVTILIILVESILLRSHIEDVPYRDTLWRCVVLNLVSSVAGSVLLLGLGRDSFFVWDTLSLVFPLFVITVVTEVPALRLLYKQVPLSWARACVLGVGVNVASYAVVFVVEMGLLVGFFSYAARLDKTERSEWVHPELLSQSSGWIYATETPRAGVHRLRVLDPRTGRWQSLTNCPDLDPNKWDIERRTCAFVRWPPDSRGDGAVVIASLPGFSIIREIALSSLLDPRLDGRSAQGRVADLSLSPDGKKLAVLLSVGEAVAYRDSSSYYNLGQKCALTICAADSGQKDIRAGRWASARGVCWFPDSSAVLFTSFTNQALYMTTEADVRGDRSYGIGYAKVGTFGAGLFSFNVETRDIRHFSDGEEPVLSVARREFMIRDDAGVHWLDIDGRRKEMVEIAHLNDSRPGPSPAGNLVLVEIRRHQPLYPAGRLTLVDLARPTVRHIVADDRVYRFKWTTSAEDGPADGAAVSP